MNQTKTCTKCHIEKSISEFQFRKDSNNYRNDCKSCNNAARNARYYASDHETLKIQNQEYYLLNRDKKLKYVCQYRIDNRDKILICLKKYYAKNKDKMNAFSKQYYQANKQQLIERQKLYNKTTKGKAVKKADSHNRRTAKLNNGGKHTGAEILNLFDLQSGMCPYCKNKLNKSGKNKYHIDHVIPLAKGGTNDISNIQILCAHCNLSKSNKLPEEFAQSMGLLL